MNNRDLLVLHPFRVVVIKADEFLRTIEPEEQRLHNNSLQVFAQDGLLEGTQQCRKENNYRNNL